MNSDSLEQKYRFAVIGLIMIIISFVFLFYIGSSLVSSTKKYMVQIEEVEIHS